MGHFSSYAFVPEIGLKMKVCVAARRVMVRSATTLSTDAAI